VELRAALAPLAAAFSSGGRLIKRSQAFLLAKGELDPVEELIKPIPRPGRAPLTSTISNDKAPLLAVRVRARVRRPPCRR
jgi:hypothetical protein